MGLGDHAVNSPTVVLASASPGRLSVLRGAGIEPVVLVSDVDEDAVRETLHAQAPAAVVTALAAAKAAAVVTSRSNHRALADAVVIGGDSMLLIDGELQGKPHTAVETRRRWERQLGRAGDLVTGHAVIRVQHGAEVARATGAVSATVTLGRPTDRELAAYIASGEPLEVAGAFTVDRLGGWFVERIDGDPSCVVGLSLPLTRRLLADVGVTVTDLWHSPPTE